MKNGIENVKRIMAFGAEFGDVLSKGLKNKNWSAMSELIDEAFDLSRTEWDQLKPELLDLSDEEKVQLMDIVKSKVDVLDEDLENMLEDVLSWVIESIDLSMSIVKYTKAKKLKTEIGKIKHD